MPSPVVILTGASRGLGLAIARSLLSVHGARVATLQRTLTPELEALAGEFGADRILNITGSVAKPEDNVKVVDAAVAKWGQLDSVILNAGTLDPLGKLADVPLDSLVPALETNLLSALYLLQPALPHLRKAAAATAPARVIFVSSGAAVGGYQAWGMYSLAKAGLNSFARTFASEEREAGVAFLSVRPGVIDMQAHIRAVGPGAMAPTDMSKFNSLHAEGKLLRPEQPGSVIAGAAVGVGLELSGEFVNWEDERLAAWREKQ
ncbi:putative oxidoreductase [Vanrija pseudolonga]|uniref:Purtative oxidoreductase n=1 Tax=Vanrija pseudolonga TaxID=143232 RepID=A0AAF0XZT6_9TREE|nr:purtative oxidoreductase [Vanrija pseudolonga]